MVPLCIYSYYGSWILASYILYLVTNSGCIYYCFFLFLYRSHGLWVVWDWHIFFCCSVQQTEKNRNKKYRKKNVPFCCCTGDTACWLCGIGTFIFFLFFHFVVTHNKLARVGFLALSLALALPLSLCAQKLQQRDTTSSSANEVIKELDLQLEASQV